MHELSRACRASGWVLFGALSLCLHASAARAQDADDDDPNEVYRGTVSEAVQEFAGGNWAEARALFKRAHSLSPSARTLRGMGMAAYELRMYVPARRELEAALREPKKALDAEQRDQVQKLIKLASAFVGRYQVTLEPANAIPRIDGRDALFEPGSVLLLELGTHELSATAEGYQAGSIKFRTEGGEDKELHLALVPTAQAAIAPMPPPVAQPLQTAPVNEYADDAAAGPPLAAWGWVMVGTTAVFGGAAGAFWGLGSRKYGELETECGGPPAACTEQQISDSGVKTLDTLTSVFLGLAGASALTATVLFIVDAGHQEKASGRALNLRVGPAGVLVDGRF